MIVRIVAPILAREIGEVLSYASRTSSEDWYPAASLVETFSRCFPSVSTRGEKICVPVDEKSTALIDAIKMPLIDDLPVAGFSAPRKSREWNGRGIPGVRIENSVRDRSRIQT